MQGAGLQNIMSGLQGAGNTLSAQQYYNALTQNGGAGGMGGGVTDMQKYQRLAQNGGAGGMGGGVTDMQKYQRLAQNGFQGGGNVADNMYNNSMFSEQPSPFQQQTPFNMMLNNFGGGYYNGVGNPNFVQQPQFQFKI